MNNGNGPTTISPDLPRWVSSRRVDSESILSFFLAYQMECNTKEKSELAVLCSVEHAMQEIIVVDGQLVGPQRMGGPLLSIPCTDRDCERFSAGRGGCKSRWYSPKWSHSCTELVENTAG